MRPSATSAWGLKLLLYGALSDLQLERGQPPGNRRTGFEWGGEVFGIEARELLAVSRSAQPQHIQHVYELLGGPTAGRCMRHASAAYVSACMQLRQRSRTAGGPNGRGLGLIHWLKATCTRLRPHTLRYLGVGA
jgi:hypothetical protein